SPGHGGRIARPAGDDGRVDPSPGPVHGGPGGGDGAVSGGGASACFGSWGGRRQRPGGTGLRGRRLDLQLFAQERVLPPTPRRLREARRRGEVARSADLGAALLLLAVVATASLWWPHMASSLTTLARSAWSEAVGGDWTVADVAATTRGHLLAV